ncbi:MAG: hypothetical protein HC857_09890 [Synechococcales cyanobacterium RU_4_20]|nr:hypothetical protein [Synechococcales cyanobacterium RU_4_20]
MTGLHAQVAFGKKTKDYLRRRVWRSLQHLGDLGDTTYVSLATEVLLQYSDADAQATRASTYYRWDVNWRRSVSGQAAWDQYAPYLAFNHILYTHSPRYLYRHGTQAWRCQRGYEPGGPLPAECEEAFPALWQRQPEALLRLLLESRCQPVHEFAVRALRHCLAVSQPTFGDRLTLEQLIQLLRQPYLITAEFAFEQVRDRYQAGNPNFDLLLAVANCAYAPARAAAHGWIAAQRDLVLANAPLVAALIVSPEAETRAYTRQLLRVVVSPERFPKETLRMIVGQAIAILLVLEAGERLQEAIQTLEECFVQTLVSLGLDVILDLLRHPLEPLQVFGATRLLNHTTPAADLPTGLLDALMESPTNAVRVIGVRLLGQLPDSALIRKPELLIVLATHPLPDMREAIRPTLVRLLENHRDFCDRLLPLLLLELQRPATPSDVESETSEALERNGSQTSDTGVQDFLIQLLGQEVTHWMAAATPAQALQLLDSETSAAQELAGLILQTNAAIWHEHLSTTEIGELTHHEIQSVRHAGCQMLQHHLPSLRSNPDELLNAVIALESPWEEARASVLVLFT